MRVRDSFGNPEYSDFAREAVAVGEVIETQGFELQGEHYSQGEQSFTFRKGEHVLFVTLGDWADYEDEEEDK